MIMNEQSVSMRHPNSGRQQASSQNEAPREGLTVEPIKFNNTTEGQLTTSASICSLVNSLFSKICHDYKGSIIVPNGTGQLSLTLFFTDNGQVVGDSKFKNLVNINAPNPNENRVDRMNRYMSSYRNRTYDLSDDTKDLLDEFMIKPANARNQKFNWNRHDINNAPVKETINAVNGGFGNQIVVSVDGIDVMKVLKKIYGKKNAAGNYVEYQINIIKPIGIMVGNNANLLLSINRLDVKELEKICTKLGMCNVVQSVPMVTDIG